MTPAINHAGQVYAALKQPGRSGTAMPKALLRVPVSIAIVNFMMARESYREYVLIQMSPACFLIFWTSPLPRSFFGCGTVR
jgi:hypothetical protein